MNRATLNGSGDSPPGSYAVDSRGIVALMLAAAASLNVRVVATKCCSSPPLLLRPHRGVRQGAILLVVFERGIGDQT